MSGYPLLGGFQFGLCHQQTRIITWSWMLDISLKGCHLCVTFNTSLGPRLEDMDINNPVYEPFTWHPPWNGIYRGLLNDTVESTWPVSKNNFIS